MLQISVLKYPHPPSPKYTSITIWMILLKEPLFRELPIKNCVKIAWQHAISVHPVDLQLGYPVSRKVWLDGRYIIAAQATTHDEFSI